MPNKRHSESRWDRNRRHWEENLDAQNLGGTGEVDLNRDLALYETIDFREARRFLYPLVGRTILDLGGGLGLAAIHFARDGARVIVADLSLPRLRAARALAERAGVADRITFLQCSADQLPFRTGSLDRQFTKSVLIHTPLAETSAELARTLAPDGLACFIEPLDANPFVNLYRRLAAPGEWRTITSYFNRRSMGTVLCAFPHARKRATTRLYFVAFFATPFNYSLQWPRAYRVAENILTTMDRILFAVLPMLKGYAWFTLMKVSPTRDDDRGSASSGR